MDYVEENGCIIKKPEKCTKTGMMKAITDLLVHGWDSEYITGADTVLTIWARDKYGNLDSFNIEPDAIDKILRGNDEFRRELRREYREFLRDKKIEGIHISDAYTECCYGTPEICDFDEMVRQLDNYCEMIQYD